MIKGTVISLLFIFLLKKDLPAQEKTDTIKTDSSIIITRTREAGGTSIHEYYTDKNIVKYKFYSRRQTLEEQGYYDTSGNVVGIWKQYDEKGTLLRQEDYNKRSWIVFDKKLYPYKGLMDGMKIKGDEILKKWYGKQFFEKHIKWSMSGSYMYDDNDDLQENWTEPTSVKPTKFLLRYDIVYDKLHIYEEMIEFEINSEGNFIIESNGDIKGFEKPGIPVYKLSIKEAIQKAKAEGMKETDSIKPEAFLFWEPAQTEKPAVQNGSFKFYITEFINNEKTDFSKPGHYLITNHYNVYIFSPWTGKFLEKRKMKIINRWEGSHGGSSGLIAEEQIY
ncbi:MAG TPA: hypothetical protein VK483_16615 [Chitinophagaceae bacterium]|nr:hypothetical protein [Chitinophagaceae bacterium]